MENLNGKIWAKLRTLVSELGKDGGIISPSVYDTAQVLRLYPPQEGVEAGLGWLLAQQQSDGGWGNPEVPTARDVPTLAAVLTLHTYCTISSNMQEAVQAGLIFLCQQAAQWSDAPIDSLPIATEMILPYLVTCAQQAGLSLPQAPYARLFKLRKQKLDYLANKQLVPGAAPTYSWEALGRCADSGLLDDSGSIGQNPTATAAWLSLLEDSPSNENVRELAQQYLARAQAATELDIPGVVPHAWPVTGFELSYGLYALLLAGLLDHPELATAVQSQSARLHAMMHRERGISFSEYFTPDVDDTAAALAVLNHLGYNVDPKFVLQFQNQDHFYTYPHELNPSVLSNAHALYALAHCDKRYTTIEEFLVERQTTDGYWPADKWHSSWHYTTLEVLIALAHFGYEQELAGAQGAFLNTIHVDGGWGLGGKSTITQTTYSVMALQRLAKYGQLDEAGWAALRRGEQWLEQNYQEVDMKQEMYWLGKELYSPYRVDQIYVLCTMVSKVSDNVTA